MAEELRQGDSHFLNDKIADFELSFREEDSEHLDNQFSDKSRSYSLELIKELILNLESYENLIRTHLEKRAFDRVNKMAMAILLIACVELKKGMVPHRVVLDEAIELAKSLGPEDSNRFVNGVLDAVKRELDN